MTALMTDAFADPAAALRMFSACLCRNCAGVRKCSYLVFPSTVIPESLKAISGPHSDLIFVEGGIGSRISLPRFRDDDVKEVFIDGLMTIIDAFNTKPALKSATRFPGNPKVVQ